jgi:tetratricopeptide (TPR) repeat protein
VATQINDAKRRVEEHPNDLTLRFDLGQTFLEEGKIAEAIQEFQKSQNNPHLKTRSLFNLGQCFARRRMFDMAARSYQNALKEKLIFDEEKKELVYSLAHLLEQMGKRDEAIEQYKQIYEIDIGYKDVAQKVDEYYSS